MMESTLKELTLSEVGEYFQEDAPIFFFFSPFPAYCVEFCPCAKVCFPKSKPILVEAVAVPGNSAPALSLTLCYTFVLGFLLRKLRGDSLRAQEQRRWRLIAKAALQRGAVRGCGRSDLSEQQLRGLSQHVGDSDSLCCSLLAQCSFWSWEQKPTPATSVCSFCVERRTEGERGVVTGVVYFQVILRNMFTVFLTGADSNWNGEDSKMPIILYLMLVLCDSFVGHGKSFNNFFLLLIVIQ